MNFKIDLYKLFEELFNVFNKINDQVYDIKEWL